MKKIRKIRILDLWLSLVPAVRLAEYHQVARVLISFLSPIQLCQITEETPGSDLNHWKISHWAHPFLIHPWTTRERKELLPLCYDAWSKIGEIVIRTSHHIKRRMHACSEWPLYPRNNCLSYEFIMHKIAVI